MLRRWITLIGAGLIFFATEPDHAQTFSGSCPLPKHGLCMHFSGGISQAEADGICGRQKASIQNYVSCATEEVAAKCLNRIGSGSIETLFYYPIWTVNLVQERCAKSGGILSR